MEIKMVNFAFMGLSASESEKSCLSCGKTGGAVLLHSLLKVSLHDMCSQRSRPKIITSIVKKTANTLLIASPTDLAQS